MNIVNLISIGGIDEKILDTIYSKKSVADAIVENQENEVQYLSSLTHDVMRKLLTKKKHKNRGKK